LDSYPGAAAAYSVRLLSSTYVGPLLKVVRTSDSAELDVYPDANGDLDTSAIATFIGSGEGRVSVWYDQSGNGHDVTDQSSSNKRPVIVDSGGSLVTVNGTVALDFNLTYSTNGLRKTGSLSEFISDDITVIAVGTNSSTANTASKVWVGESGISEKTYIRNSTNGSQFTNWVRDTAAGFDNLNNPIGTLTGGAQYIHFCWSDFAAQQMGYQINGTYLGAVGRSVGVQNTSDGIGIGIASYTTTAYWTGHIQEVIVYPSNQETDQSDIVDNINTYYGTY
jgi:hypothetical protein